MIVLALLSGCFVRYEPIREAARAERRDDPAAEARWEDVLDRELLVGEWRHARRRLCSLRADRIDALLPTLDPVTVPYEELTDLRADLVGCPGTGALQAELVALEQHVAEARLRPVLAGNRKPYTVLRDALPHVRHLTPGSTLWPELDRLRDRWVEHLRATRERLPGPVARAWVTDLLREAGVEEAGPGGIETVEVLLAQQVGTFEVDTEGSCPPPRRYVAADEAGQPVRVQLHLSGCEEAVRRGQVQVTYQETLYRDELQDVEVRVPYTTATTITNINCYNSLKYGGQICTPVGTHTKYETTYETHIEKRVVQVPYTVERTRMEDRWTQSAALTWSATVHSRDGTWELPPSLLRDSATTTASPPRGMLWPALAERAAVAAREASLHSARRHRLEALQAQASPDTPEGVEALLILDRSGSPLDAETRASVASWAGLPAQAFAADRPAIGDVAPRPLEAHSLTYRFPRVEQGLVRYGFSPLMLTTGFGTLHGGEFAAHATPKSTALQVQYEGNLSVSTGRAANGLALHLTPQLDLHVGWRANPRQEFAELPPGRTENDREPRQAQGVRVGTALLAGIRSTGLGLFVGLHPQAHFAMSGFYKNGGARLPLAARLELRPVPRRPLFVQGWYGDLLDPSVVDWGLRAGLPVGDRLWLTAERSTNTGRTELRGLHQQDILAGGPRPLQRTLVGLTYGF